MRMNMLKNAKTGSSRGTGMGDEIVKLKTNADLLKKLRETQEPSAAEVKEQRVSFAYGALSSKSPMTREQVRQMVECT